MNICIQHLKIQKGQYSEDLLVLAGIDMTDGLKDLYTRVKHMVYNIKLWDWVKNGKEVICRGPGGGQKINLLMKK